jgi:hypothetical protein
LHNLCEELAISLPKLTQEFDKIKVEEGLQVKVPIEAINLLIDAVFFGREFGYLCFHDTSKIIYFHEIKNESLADLRQGLFAIKNAGFKIKSVTIDGRRGAYQVIKKMFGPVPIQMCLFHQKAIIRRYIGSKPKTICGQELNHLMKNICLINAQNFIDSFYELKRRHKGFLNERNAQKQYAHLAIRSAFNSVKNNMFAMFTYADIPCSKIPPTNNHLEGLFGHLKTNLKIHRGLSKTRKKNAIKFFLKNFKKSPK